MPSKTEIRGAKNSPGHYLQAAIDDVQWHSGFARQQFIPNYTGEMSVTAVGEEHVIKVALPDDDYPRSTRFGGYKQALFEAYANFCVNEAGTPSPIALSSLEEAVSTNGPNYNVFTKVQGEVFDREAVRRFTAEEQTNLGRQIGVFVAWMGQNVTFDSYNEALGLSGYKPFDRISDLELWGDRAAYYDMPGELSALILDIHDEYVRLSRSNLLNPTIIGHDDLRPAGNMAFVRENDTWMLNGIFDFGLMKPSSPERELRHLTALPVALDSAMSAYESATCSSLSKELIVFWGLAQSVTTFANVYTFGSPELAHERLQDMKYLLSSDRLRQLSKDCYPG